MQRPLHPLHYFYDEVFFDDNCILGTELLAAVTADALFVIDAGPLLGAFLFVPVWIIHHTERFRRTCLMAFAAADTAGIIEGDFWFDRLNDERERAAFSGQVFVDMIRHFIVGNNEVRGVVSNDFGIKIAKLQFVGDFQGGDVAWA